MINPILPLPLEKHILQCDILPAARPAYIAPASRARRLAHKRVFLLPAAIAALGFDEQAVAMVRAQTARVFKEHVGFALAHFAEDDDVVRVLWCLI